MSNVFARFRDYIYSKYLERKLEYLNNNIEYVEIGITRMGWDILIHGNSEEFNFVTPDEFYDLEWYLQYNDISIEWIPYIDAHTNLYDDLSFVRHLKNGDSLILNDVCMSRMDEISPILDKIKHIQLNSIKLKFYQGDVQTDIMQFIRDATRAAIYYWSNGHYTRFED
jgi:hypothetical protein